MPRPVPPPHIWLSEHEERVWRSLGNMVHRLRLALERELESDAGLSFVEYYAMARLSEEPEGRLRMSELAAAVNASLSRLSHLVKRLESWGCVRREPDPSDGRYTVAILTKTGYANLRKAAPAHVACVRELVIGDFGPRELEQLLRLSERITARIDASPWRQELV
jgi:DNA-binding MarR family transcriptional regulator